MFKILFILLLCYLIMRFIFRVLVRSFIVKVAKNGGAFTYSNQRNSSPNQGYRTAGNVQYDPQEAKAKKSARKAFDPGGEYIDFEEIK